MKRFSLYIAAALITLLASPLQVAAVESGGVGGKPAYPRADNPRSRSIFIYELDPSEKASDGVRIFNNTSEAQTVSIYAVDSELSSGGAFACKQAVDKKEDVGSWIKLGKDEVKVAPNDSVVVPFTITAPSKVEVGEHNGCIAMQAASQTASETSTGGVQLSFRSAIRVAVNVPGNIVKKINIEDISLSPSGNGKYVLMPTVHNSGNVSLDTDVTASLVSVFGSSVATATGDYPVLSGSKTSWNFEVDRPFWGGLYRANVSIAYNADPAAQLGASANGDLETQSRTSGLVFIMPQPAAAAIEFLGLLIVMAIVAFIIRRMRHKRHVKRHWKTYTVKEGETLDQLADHHDVSWKRIAKANSLKAPYALREGQKVRLPVRKG